MFNDWIAGGAEPDSGFGARSLESDAEARAPGDSFHPLRLTARTLEIPVSPRRILHWLVGISAALFLAGIGQRPDRETGLRPSPLKTLP